MSAFSQIRTASKKAQNLAFKLPFSSTNLVYKCKIFINRVARYFKRVFVPPCWTFSPPLASCIAASCTLHASTTTTTSLTPPTLPGRRASKFTQFEAGLVDGVKTKHCQPTPVWQHNIFVRTRVRSPKLLLKPPPGQSCWGSSVSSVAFWSSTMCGSTTTCSGFTTKPPSSSSSRQACWSHRGSTSETRLTALSMVYPEVKMRLVYFELIHLNEHFKVWIIWGIFKRQIKYNS